LTTPTTTETKEIRINDREQLIYLLTEAAEIEHGLMCCYLYAAWSLKESVDEGLTEEQLAAVSVWRARIHGVAMEEMLHLALVTNLLMSIGSPPHFGRQNFPVRPGYHPASLVIRLQKCNLDTLAHFIYLERPEGTSLPQAPGFESELGYKRSAGGVKLTPNAEDYDTVGHLYRGIGRGFELLAEELGEAALFIGAPSSQVHPEILSLPGMQAVTDLESARTAIATIVEQGEGGRQDHEKSHFAHFTSIAKQYEHMLEADPAFQPYRDLAPDPLMFPPIPGTQGTHVNAPEAAAVLDLANACYGLMLRLLASGCGANYDDPARSAQIGSAIAVMSIVKTLSVFLTTLPATNIPGERRASMNFHLSRSTLALPQREGGLALLAERARELAGAARLIAWSPDSKEAGIVAKLAAIGAELAEQVACPSP
jgi:hypothetical protein